MPQLESRIRQKADSAANWEANNPVLLDGEIAVAVTGSGETRLKVGDGTKRFSQQTYLDELLRQRISDTETRLDTKADLTDGKVRPEQMTSRYVLVTGSRMLTPDDQGKLLVAASASPVTLTIPRDATALIPDGTEIQILQYGPGTVTVAGETAGVLIDSLNDRYATLGMFSALRVKKLMPNEWMLEGASSVPVTRTINGKPLSANVTITAAELGAVTLDQFGYIDPALTLTPMFIIQSDYNLDPIDAGYLLTVFTKTSARIILRNNLPMDFCAQVKIARFDTGEVVIEPASGVSIFSKNNMRRIASTFGSVTLWYLDNNQWWLEGDLAA